MERKTEIMYRRVWEKVRENVEIACQTAITENGISRTNNKVEGWHNAFARLVERNHRNILKFSAYLQKELSLADIKMDTIHMRTT
ncbi:hypothetical protein HZS_5272 [Henneguya salminicola]|nr:hypothetical protein HZS_5272 [Henneguya salminicola]